MKYLFIPLFLLMLCGFTVQALAGTNDTNTIKIDVASGKLTPAVLPFHVPFILEGEVGYEIDSMFITFVEVPDKEIGKVCRVCDTTIFLCAGIEYELRDACTKKTYKAFNTCVWKKKTAKEKDVPVAFQFEIKPLKANTNYKLCVHVFRKIPTEAAVYKIANDIISKNVSSLFTKEDNYADLDQKVQQLFSDTCLGRIQENITKNIKELYKTDILIISPLLNDRKELKELLLSNPFISKLRAFDDTYSRFNNNIKNTDSLLILLNRQSTTITALLGKQKSIGFTAADTLLLFKLKTQHQNKALMGFEGSVVKLQNLNAGSVLELDSTKRKALLEQMVSCFKQAEALQQKLNDFLDKNKDSKKVLKTLGIPRTDIDTFASSISSYRYAMGQQIATLNNLNKSDKEFKAARFFDRFDIRIHSDVSISMPVSGLADFKTRASWYIVPDLGFALSFANNLQTGLHPYYGVNFNLGPVNRDAHYSILKIGYNNLPDHRMLLRSFSVVLGVTTNKVSIPEERISGYFDNNTSPLAGMGIRINNFVRITGGVVFMRQAEINPLLTNTNTIAQPFVAFSIDAELRTIAGKFIETFFK